VLKCTSHVHELALLQLSGNKETINFWEIEKYCRILGTNNFKLMAITIGDINAQTTEI